MPERTMTLTWPHMTIMVNGRRMYVDRGLTRVATTVRALNAKLPQPPQPDLSGILHRKYA